MSQSAAPAPLWLAAPSRFATIARTRAWAILALLAILMALCLISPAATSSAGTAPPEDAAATDLALYTRIIAGMRGGGGYYDVAAQELRRGDYPMRPFLTVRLPTLATVQASLPPWGSAGLLYFLATVTAAGWLLRLRTALARTPALLVAMVLFAGGATAYLQAQIALFHEIWAGLLIALALAVWRPGRWGIAVAVGLAAMLIRETAALFVAVMAGAALVERQYREVAGWCLAIAAFAVVMALHAQAVAAVVRLDDPASPGWAGLLGFGFFVKAMTMATALSLVPLWLATPLVVGALLGWAGWRDDFAVRVLATLLVYAVLLSLAARIDTFYWGLMVAILLLPGLAFAPDAIRDVITAARRAPEGTA